MTRDEIIERMGWLLSAKKAMPDILDRIESIAVAAAIAEREACANLCDEIAERNEADHDSCWSYGNWECAAAIRARGQTTQPTPEHDLSRCPNCGGVMDCEFRANLNFCRRCQRA